MELETEWIDEFDRQDEPYCSLYKAAQDTISAIYLYVNRENELFHSRQEPLSTENGTLRKAVLVDALKRNRIYAGIKYRPLSLLRYDIGVGPDSVCRFVQEPETQGKLVSEASIEDMSWRPAAPCLQQVNCLYVVFMEVWDAGGRKTKRIRLRRQRGARRTRSKPLKDS
jgi:hypothetical protein